MNRAELLKIAKPILFNTEMVKAILDSRKTVTRRVLKLPKWIWWTDEENGFMNFATDKDGYGDSGRLHVSQLQDYYSPYKVGDYLYVRETWQKTSFNYIYKASIDLDYYSFEDLENFKWRPSIHMPKEAARIFLRVTDVRIEMLQDITEEQAIKEGFYIGYQTTLTSTPSATARQAFMWVWNKIYNDINQWLIVVEFERMEI